MRASFPILTITNGVTACLMIAALSLLAVEAIGPAHALTLAGTILWSRWRASPVVHPRLWDLLALLALVAFPFDLFVISRNLIGAALRLLTFVVIYRCSNLSGHRELQQALSLSFVQMLAAAASTTEVGFLPLLAGYLLLAIWTLMAMASARDEAPVTARRPPEARPAAALTLCTLALGGGIFFTIPHFGTGYFPRGTPAGDGLTGFSDRIELGSINRIKKSRTVVMRVSLEGDAAGARRGRDALRWRGMALDSFDGRSWESSGPGKVWLDADPSGAFQIEAGRTAPGPELTQVISLEPILTQVLFAPPGTSRISADEVATLGRDAGGSLHLPSPHLRRFTYRVTGPDPALALAGYGAGSPPADLARFLTLPRVDPRIESLTRRVAGDSGADETKALSIEEYLRTNHAYTLEVNDAGVADPLAHFLLERRPGHCEYFATAMAVMLRYEGIPSRVVNGFASAEGSAPGQGLIVRQTDAHSWVEAWIPRRGWVTFDPTPAAGASAASRGLLARMARWRDQVEILWDTWIVGLDILDQRVIVSRAAEAVGLFFGATAGFLSSLAAGARALAADRLPEAIVAAGLILAAGLALPQALRLARAALRPASPPAMGRAGDASQATALLRRFERRWARRGVRRAPGQTPLELAGRIESLSLLPPGEARALIAAYYRLRFGR